MRIMRDDTVDLLSASVWDPFELQISSQNVECELWNDHEFVDDKIKHLHDVLSKWVVLVDLLNSKQ